MCLGSLTVPTGQEETRDLSSWTPPIDSARGGGGGLPRPFPASVRCIRRLGDGEGQWAKAAGGRRMLDWGQETWVLVQGPRPPVSEPRVPTL